MTSPAADGDASGAPSTDHTGRYVRQPNGRTTPMSPYMEVWRWHITMLASILFRVTIGAATVAAVIVLGWIAALASGPEVYTGFLSVAASPFGVFIGIGLTWVLFSFLLNGARHLINDAGQGLKLKPADLLSHIAVWGPFVLTALTWVILFATGRVTL